MTTTITYDHTRVRTTEYVYDVEVDGVLVATANRYHDAELVALEVDRRAPSAIVAGIDALDAALETIRQAAADALNSITVEGLEIHAPADEPACPCGSPALFFVQYPDRVYAYCPDHYLEQSRREPPLLAQCAAVIRRCLGSTTGAGGIIEELRRVETALAKEGW